MPSTTWPVPSGEPSSTTRTSNEGSCARIAGTMRGMFSRSLYVGIITSAFSGNASPLGNDTCADDQQDRSECNQCDGFSGHVSRVGEGKLDVPCPLRQRHADERVVCTSSSPFPAVDGCLPACKIV